MHKICTSVCVSNIYSLAKVVWEKNNCFGVGFLCFFVFQPALNQLTQAQLAGSFVLTGHWFILGKKAKDEDAEQAVDKEG